MDDSAPADTGGGLNAADAVKPGALDAIIISEEHQQQEQVVVEKSSAGMPMPMLTVDSIGGLGSDDDDEHGRDRKRPRKLGIKRQCKICGELGHYQKTCQSRPRGSSGSSMSTMMGIQAAMMQSTQDVPDANESQRHHHHHHPQQQHMAAHQMQMQMMARKRHGTEEDLLMPQSESDSGKVPLLNSTAQASSVPQCVRLDPHEHVPFTISEGFVGECVVCYKKHEASEGKGPDAPAGRTCLKCIRCGVFLCSTLENPCWKDFHTKADLFSSA